MISTFNNENDLAARCRTRFGHHLFDIRQHFNQQEDRQQEWADPLKVDWNFPVSEEFLKN